jgi:predicted transport protein
MGALCQLRASAIRHAGEGSCDMNRLIQAIERIRLQLPELRHRNLKETPTRTIVIDPLLEALGWNVRSPDEVELEYPTIDGKSVDYALKIDRKPVLLVEAKALDDTLDDVKAVTQVVGYAANNGIAWCVLTNGITWRMYRSFEECPAPKKLMFEVSLDPDISEGMTVEQIAKQMGRLSRESIPSGRLEDLAEQIFTDGKIRKAIQVLMTNPPKPFLRLVRSTTGDKNLVPQRIKESLIRIAQEPAPGPISIGIAASGAIESGAPIRQSRIVGANAKKTPEKPTAKKGESPCDESHHLTGKPQEAISLYRALDRICLSFMPGGISRRFLVKTINYEYGKRCFCSVTVLQGGMRVWLQLQYGQMENPPDFARDVAKIGHWGAGDVELRISDRAELDEAVEWIRRSFEAVH